MAQAVEEWYQQMPIITRSYLTAAVLTTVGCTLEIILSYHLYLNPKLVVQHYRIGASSPTSSTSARWVCLSINDARLLSTPWSKCKAL
uniref:Derlin n=1 Tax=Aegilops tauschii subsp. strangulata TaxID=200361 RepID=A0A453GKE9_AEGTS